MDRNQKERGRERKKKDLDEQNQHVGGVLLCPLAVLYPPSSLVLSDYWISIERGINGRGRKKERKKGLKEWVAAGSHSKR